MIIRKVNVLNYSKKISKGAFSPPGALQAWPVIYNFADVQNSIYTYS